MVRSRSRSRSPKRDRERMGRRSRSRSRDRERRRERPERLDRHRERERERPPVVRERDRRRSRSQSPSGRWPRGRSPPRRGRSRSLSPGPPGSKVTSDSKDQMMERPEIDESMLQGKSGEEIEMMKVMGFCGFDTTKGTKTKKSKGLHLRRHSAEIPSHADDQDIATINRTEINDFCSSEILPGPNSSAPRCSPSGEYSRRTDSKHRAASCTPYRRLSNKSSPSSSFTGTPNRPLPSYSGTPWSSERDGSLRVTPRSQYSPVSHLSRPSPAGGTNWLRKGRDQPPKHCEFCQVPGHYAGSRECDYYSHDPEIVPFQGAGDVLSNFYPCTIELWGYTFRSSEHAYQYRKAIEWNQPRLAEDMMVAETARDVKIMSRKLQAPSSGAAEYKHKLMKEVIKAKADQVQEYQDMLLSATKDTVYGEATTDRYWATGLDREHTRATHPDRWPGWNHLGILHKALALEMKKKPTLVKHISKSVTPLASVVIHRELFQDFSKGCSRQGSASEVLHKKRKRSHWSDVDPSSDGSVRQQEEQPPKKRQWKINRGDLEDMQKQIVPNVNPPIIYTSDADRVSQSQSKSEEGQIPDDCETPGCTSDLSQSKGAANKRTDTTDSQLKDGLPIEESVSQTQSENTVHPTLDQRKENKKEKRKKHYRLKEDEIEVCYKHSNTELLETKEEDPEVFCRDSKKKKSSRRYSESSESEDDLDEPNVPAKSSPPELTRRKHLLKVGGHKVVLQDAKGRCKDSSGEDTSKEQSSTDGHDSQTEEKGKSCCKYHAKFHKSCKHQSRNSGKNKKEEKERKKEKSS